MDTPMVISVAPSPLPSAKGSSSIAGGSSSSRKAGEVYLQIDTPTSDDHNLNTNTNNVLLGNPEDFSQRSATMSFWFPRRDGRHRDRRRGREDAQRDSTTAIQPGDPIDIFELKKLGLVLNYMAIGFFEGTLPLLARVLYKHDSYQATQLATAQHLALLVRVVFALFSDTVLPGSKHRRRVFLVAGWLVTVVLCAFLASVLTNRGSGVSPTSALDEFFALLVVLPVGYVLAGVSADALMVEYAHREDLRERGCVQMLLVATRCVGDLIGRSAMSTGNAPTAHQPCQGELDCVLDPKYTFIIAAGVALVALVGSVFVTHVPSRRRLALQGHAATTTVATKLQHVWTFLQHPMYLAFTVFGFLQAASLAWATPSTLSIVARYVDVGSATRWISDGVSVSLQMVAALLMMALWRNTHWRLLTLVLVAVSTLLARLPADVLVLLNTSRSPIMFFGLHHVASLAESLMAMVRLLVAVEMAVPTMEATSFTVTTATFDLGTIVGSLASTKVGELRAEQMVANAPAAEWLVVVCVSMYVLRATVDVISLYLLPIQKDHIQEQRDDVANAPSFASGIALGMLLVLLVGAAAFNIKALATGTTGVPWTANTWLSQ